MTHEVSIKGLQSQIGMYADLIIWAAQNSPSDVQAFEERLIRVEAELQDRYEQNAIVASIKEEVLNNFVEDTYQNGFSDGADPVAAENMAKSWDALLSLGVPLSLMENLAKASYMDGFCDGAAPHYSEKAEEARKALLATF